MNSEISACTHSGLNTIIQRLYNNPAVNSFHITIYQDPNIEGFMEIIEFKRNNDPKVPIHISLNHCDNEEEAGRMCEFAQFKWSIKEVEQHLLTVPVACHLFHLIDCMSVKVTVGNITVTIFIDSYSLVDNVLNNITRAFDDKSIIL